MTRTAPSRTAARPSTRGAERTRAAWEQEAEQGRRKSIAIGAIVSVVGIVLAVLLVRGAYGFVSGLLSSKKPAAQQQETSAQDAPVAAEAAGHEVRIELAMIGDILQHAGVYESGYQADGTRNYDHVFAHLGGELDGMDIKVVNQETLIGGADFGFSGYPTFNGPQEMGDAEVRAGFNVVLRATNHAMDMGYDGLASEMSYWKTQHPEVAVLGAANPYDTSTSIDDVYVFEKDGFKVALLNYTYGLNGIEDTMGVVSLLDVDHVRATMQKADAMADMIVVFPHWGEEYELAPVDSQYEMAEILMDCGADVIIGGHPHVIEPVEVLTASDGRKVPCFWSVGNFISTQIDNPNLVGGVAKVTMVKAADGTCSVERCSFIPTITHKGLGSSMTTYLLRDYTDDLAMTNYLESNGTDNTSLTVAWANDFCLQVLGSGFDTASEQIAFGPEAFAAAPQAQDSAATPDATATETVEEELLEAA